MAKGTSQPFVAIGHYTDGSTLDISDSVTWSLSDESLATISGNGILTGAGAGTTKALLPTSQPLSHDVPSPW
ncbi:Ig-like domain-containing protein [Aeromonas veronii]|uniref:Ig-like domain-containing protein n=1 Tax=Aeromonas veronii TaxID=654 RepID=UPI003BF84C22